MDIDTANIVAVFEKMALPAPDFPAAGEPDAGETLRGFIGSARAAGDSYSALVRRISHQGAARTLLDIARQERDTERLLETEHLLLTGDTFASPMAAPERDSVLRRLTSARIAELENSRRYIRAAGVFPEYARLFADLAAREERHAKLLRGIVERLMA